MTLGWVSTFNQIKMMILRWLSNFNTLSLMWNNQAVAQGHLDKIVIVMIMVMVTMILVMVMVTMILIMAMMTWSMRFRGEDERSICVDKAGRRGGVHYHWGPEFQTDRLRIMMMMMTVMMWMMMQCNSMMYLTILLQLFQAFNFSFFCAEEIWK